MAFCVMRKVFHSNGLGKRTMSGVPSVERVALVACGSYNPITNMHLRMFEVARDHLHATGRYKVVCGIISPVHDDYKKKDLVSSKHRFAMCKLAAETSDWIRVDDWEISQPEWTCTRDVLKHYEEGFNKHGILSNFSRDQSHLNSGAIRVMLLCGNDFLESFAIPGLWKADHIDELTKKFGMAVISRSSCDAEKLIYEQDMIYANRTTVHLIKEWLYNEISSTKVRKALRRGESVKYVVLDSVIGYIERNGLYKS